MKNCFMLFILTAVLSLSCNIDSTGPADDLESLNWNDISIEQVYYDSLEVGSKNTIIINGRSVESIILFELENNDYVPKDTIIPTYIRTGDRYYLNFQFHKKVSKEIIHYKFKLLYKISDDRFFEVDNTHLMLRYPYTSAQLFLTADDVWKEYEITFQNIDFKDNFLFFHPGGPLGLYKYDLAKGQTSELVRYSGGDFIASDSIYVFADLGHKYIYRYNLETQSYDLEFDVSSLAIEDIQGMDCYNGFLYVTFKDESNKSYLAKFDFDGHLLGMVSYPRGRYCLTIASGIVYSQNYDAALYRMELATNTDLSIKAAPVYNGGGFRVYGDKFYFVDWDKRAIGWIPFSEIQ